MTIQKQQQQQQQQQQHQQQQQQQPSRKGFTIGIYIDLGGIILTNVFILKLIQEKNGEKRKNRFTKQPQNFIILSKHLRASYSDEKASFGSKLNTGKALLASKR